jgi:hypothetical protein
LYGELVALLARHDPLHLIESGAPWNEYEPEAETILDRLHDATSAEALQRLIHEEFERWFGRTVAGSLESYNGVAAELWAKREGLRRSSGGRLNNGESTQ